MATNNENDINITIKYATEGEEELAKAQKETEALGEQTQAQAVDVSALTKANKDQAASMKNLGTSAVSLASKLSVVGVAVSAGVGVIKSAVGIVNKYTAENDKLRSSYATLTSTINTQAATIINDKQLKEDVKALSDHLSLSQERITAALQTGTVETKNYALAMQAVERAYYLASKGVGTFEENYANLIAAYTGGLTVFSEETGQALQPGMEAFNTYFDQVKNKGNKTWGEMLVAQYKYGKATELITQYIGESLQEVKKSYLDLFTDVLKALYNFDWAELINALIIDPINGLLYILGESINTALGWISKLFKNTNLSYSPILIPRLNSKASAADQGLLDTTGGLPDYVNVPSPSEILQGTTAPTVNVTVQGSVWTTQDLADELSGVLFDNLKLRGAR